MCHSLHECTRNTRLLLQPTVSLVSHAGRLHVDAWCLLRERTVQWSRNNAAQAAEARGMLQWRSMVAAGMRTGSSHGRHHKGRPSLSMHQRSCRSCRPVPPPLVVSSAKCRGSQNVVCLSFNCKDVLYDLQQRSPTARMTSDFCLILRYALARVTTIRQDSHHAIWCKTISIACCMARALQFGCPIPSSCASICLFLGRLRKHVGQAPSRGNGPHCSAPDDCFVA